MASRSSEATGNVWGGGDHGTDPVPGGDRGDERRVAVETDDDRDVDPERRVAALEAALERRDRQLQLVVDHYESILADREAPTREPGLLTRLQDRLGL